MKETFIYKLSEIGSLIAQERKNKGFSQEQFAAMVGTSHATLSKLENGYPVNVKLLEKSLQLLGQQVVIRPKGK